MIEIFEWTLTIFATILIIIIFVSIHKTSSKSSDSKSWNSILLLCLIALVVLSLGSIALEQVITLEKNNSKCINLMGEDSVYYSDLNKHFCIKDNKKIEVDLDFNYKRVE